MRSWGHEESSSAWRSCEEGISTWALHVTSSTPFAVLRQPWWSQLIREVYANVQVSHLINRCHPTLVSFFLSLTRLPRASSNSLLCHGCIRYVGVVCHVLQLLQNRFTYTTKLVSHQQICDDASEKTPDWERTSPDFSTAYIGGPPNSSASPSLFLGV